MFGCMCGVISQDWYSTERMLEKAGLAGFKPMTRSEGNILISSCWPKAVRKVSDLWYMEKGLNHGLQHANTSFMPFLKSTTLHYTIYTLNTTLGSNLQHSRYPGCFVTHDIALFILIDGNELPLVFCQCCVFISQDLARKWPPLISFLSIPPLYLHCTLQFPPL